MCKYYFSGRTLKEGGHSSETFQCVIDAFQSGSAEDIRAVTPYTVQFECCITIRPAGFDQECMAALLEDCRALILLPGWVSSTRCQNLRSAAEKHNLPVIYAQRATGSSTGWEFLSQSADPAGAPSALREATGAYTGNVHQKPSEGHHQIFPDDDKQRLEYPVFTGLLDYFPHACAEVARHSKIGNDQHNPGEPMHWATGKSIGKGDKIVRHLLDGSRTARVPGMRKKTIRHLAAMCWRSLELLERYIQNMPPFETGDS